MLCSLKVDNTSGTSILMCHLYDSLRKETQTLKLCSGGIPQSHKMEVCNHLLYGAQQSVNKTSIQLEVWNMEYWELYAPTL